MSFLPHLLLWTLASRGRRRTHLERNDIQERNLISQMQNAATVTVKKRRNRTKKGREVKKTFSLTCALLSCAARPTSNSHTHFSLFSPPPSFLLGEEGKEKLPASFLFLFLPLPVLLLLLLLLLLYLHRRPFSSSSYCMCALPAFRGE